MRIRHPPGRSGRLWLMGRLSVAERAASILHRKQQALHREDRRLATLVVQTDAAWTNAVREAEAWQRRAMILGARRDFQSAAAAAKPAIVHLTWRTEMGVRVPAEARCEFPPRSPIPGMTALARAAAAYQRAAEAAVEHAAATSAQTRVSAELATTEQRLRAVRDRWIPQLRTTLAELELRLDEHEREELARTRLHEPTHPAPSPSEQEPT